MSLILSEINELVAFENKKCDGVQIMFDFMNTLKTLDKIKYIHDFVRMKLMKIQPTEKYLNIIFIDTDTGEQIEMNVKKNVHQKLIQRNIYPKNLVNLFLSQF